MPVVWIPSQLRSLTGGQEKLTVPGQTVRQVVEELEQRFPGIKARLCDADGLRRGIAVAVGTAIARRGLGEPVPEDGEVHFLPAVSGGSVPDSEEDVMARGQAETRYQPCPVPIGRVVQAGCWL